MRRGAIRLAGLVHLPNAVGAIGEPRRAAEHRDPEHNALHLLAAALQDALVADLALHHRHVGLALVFSTYPFERVAGAGHAAVTGLQHVIVQYRIVGHRFASGIAGMDCDGMMVGIDLTDIASDARPGFLLDLAVPFLVL